MLLVACLAMAPGLSLSLAWDGDGKSISAVIRNESSSEIVVWRRGNSWHHDSFKFEAKVAGKWTPLPLKTVFWKQNSPVIERLPANSSQRSVFSVDDFDRWEKSSTHLRVTFLPAPHASEKSLYRGAKLVTTLEIPRKES